MNLHWISDRIIGVRDRFRGHIDDFQIRKKLFVLYVFCVLMPLVLTDSFIIYVVFHSEQVARRHSMENVANAVQYNFANHVEGAAEMAKNLYINRSLNDFLGKEYADALDYVVAYYAYFQRSIFDAGMISNNIGIKLYTDNKTIIKGGKCNSIASIQESDWYRELELYGGARSLFFLYDDSRSPVIEAQRKIIFVRKMDYYSYNDPYEKVLALTLNYGGMASDLASMNYGMPVYICSGDTVILSNTGNSVRKNFDRYEGSTKDTYVQEMDLYGQKFMIYVQPPKISFMEEIRKNLPVIMLLLLVNIALPFVLVREINRSFSVRIGKLSDVFNRIEEEKLIEIEETGGQDEIGELMCNYNRMVRRVNSLIQTIYIAKMKEQEMLVARQNAELLALHSQINPHFLFNALESIRMHSILKNEYETAEMVERLALLQRQYLEWGNDFVKIKVEMEFVEAYLDLQKYRFGDRLNYELDIDENCENCRIPKLTVVTFVENACVHGIEKGRVGTVNACLRLKMMSHDKVSFEVDGEYGIGTMIQIKIPLICL